MATGIYKVINVSGLTYAFNHNGRAIVIPYNEHVYTLPNDVDKSQFGNSIKILAEILNTPEPIQQQMIEPPLSSVINISLDDIGDITKQKIVKPRNKKIIEAKQSF